MSDIATESWFKRNLYYISFFLMGVILIGIYKIDALSLAENENTSLLFYLCKEVGMAMIIAIMLVYSIEKVTREKHEKAAIDWQDNANKNLFRSIYKRYIPESVFSEVEACLLNSKICRENYHISYTLRKMNDVEKGKASNEHFIAEVRSSYILKNTVDTEVKHELITNLEVPNEDDFVQFTEITSFKVDKVDLLTNGPIKTDSNGTCTFKKFITIPKNGTVKIHMIGQTAKRNIDSESWSSRLPSNGLKLSVTAPKGIEIKCQANNSCDILRDEDQDVALTKVWVLENGIFPYQSVIMYWNGIDTK